MAVSISDKINVSHLNVRQSISFLVIKLVLVEVVASSMVIVFSLAVTRYEFFINQLTLSITFYITLFVVLTLGKMYLSCMIVLQWMYKYYEIFTNKVVHHSGFIYKREDHYVFNHLSSIGLQQGMIGRLFNYGTIEMYDRFDKKSKYMYLIHNPMRYFKIIESLLPELDERQNKIRESVLEKQDEKV